MPLDGTTLPLLNQDFPDYRAVLDALPVPAQRVVVDRVALRDALPVVCGGELRIGLDPAVLGAALEAGVGPDVLLEFAGPQQVARVRSADQGSFTTLVMPVALGTAAPGAPTSAPPGGR
ncbi:hypothetical protein [Amycolatopsis methanolica]|uniref:hypothetical protein n=1 Tax=Amycolatopsis methanolica TaxID=1814 RepID=UPI003430859F